MTARLKKIAYLSFFTLIPFFFWILPGEILHAAMLFLLGIIYILAKYIKTLSIFNDALEILFLFFLLQYFNAKSGLDRFFPLNLVITFTVLYFYLRPLRKFKAAELNLVKGKIKNSILIGIVFSLLSVAALAAWFLLQKGNPYAAMIPAVPKLLLIPMGLGFAAINAVYEEFIFRSVLLSVFSKTVGLASALILQAIWFSFLHYQVGFPSGIIGVGLTFIFGLALGYLVKRTRGLFVPVSIHFFADFSIFVLIVARMNGWVSGA